MIIPTSRGNPQASDVAVETVLPMTGNTSRQDAQSTLALNDAEVSKLYEDRNAELSQGGLISFSGTQLTFTEILTLEINSKVAGGSPIIIPLGVVGANIFSGPFNVPASGDMVYAIIDRIVGTAVVTDSAATLPTVNSSNQEVWLIGKRNDAADGTMRFYFRDGTGINAGQTIRLGAPSGINIPAGLIEMYGGVMPPPGYLLCDGSTYLVATYPDLAAVLFDSSTGNYAYGSPPAGDASYTGTITGTSTSVTLDAVTPGTTGNSIDLTFSNVIIDQSLTFNTTDDLTSSSDFISQGFTASANAVPTTAIFELNYVGAQPGGSITASIYTNVGGTPGTLLGSSNPVVCSTLSSTHTPVDFTFVSGPALTASTTYCLVLDTSAATFGIGSGIIVSVDNPSSYSGGMYADSTDGGSSWTVSPLTSAYFDIISAPSINDEIATWNAANPSNQVSLSSGDGTQIPSNGANAQLSGGFDLGDMFNVPYMNGVFPRGWTGAGGQDPDAASRVAANPGGNTGDNIGSYESDEFASHTHATVSGNNNGATSGYYQINSIVTTGHTQATGGNETRPKNLNVNFIIKF